MLNSFVDLLKAYKFDDIHINELGPGIKAKQKKAKAEGSPDPNAEVKPLQGKAHINRSHNIEGQNLKVFREYGQPN